jgi:hypothetical protein
LWNRREEDVENFESCVRTYRFGVSQILNNRVTTGTEPKAFAGIFKREDAPRVATKLIPDFTIVTLALYALVMIARFNRLLQGLLSGLLTQLFGKGLLGSLRTARNARRPQALPSSE